MLFTRHERQGTINTFFLIGALLVAIIIFVVVFVGLRKEGKGIGLVIGMSLFLAVLGAFWSFFFLSLFGASQREPGGIATFLLIGAIVGAIIGFVVGFVGQRKEGEGIGSAIGMGLLIAFLGAVCGFWFLAAFIIKGLLGIMIGGEG